MQAEITIPSSMKEITVDQWMKFTAMTKDIVDDEVFLMEKTVEILCNIPLETVRKIQYQSVSHMCAALSDILEQDPQFERSFVMDGIEYGFIPQLDDISFGEYVDLDTFLTDENNLHKAMAVLYRPIKQKFSDHYLIEDYDPGTKKKMKSMPIYYALGALGFFLNLKNELLNNTLNYLEQTTLNLTPQQRLDLQKNGAGIRASGTVLEEALQNLTMSQDYLSQPA
jgi:hypothetical protein